ncbi:MAG: AMP-binding enzyme, partial [Tumebacillaceae bacterium]
ARGYLNRPELTEERFISHPFSDDSSARLYRTGDLARYLPDGTLQYQGRIDHQVKIRGFRIELGEIESMLEQHPAVRETIVLAREDVAGEKRLVAYVVAGQEQELTVSDLRSFLKEKMPEYMVPSAFVTLPALPLTANGKVDRRALPAPEGQQRPALGSAYVAPRNESERQLVAIWQDVLGIERVGVHDNFFDLGGHSLSMVKVHSRVQELIGREFSVVDMFRAPTIDMLAKLLNQEEQGNSSKPTTEEVQSRASNQREAMQRQMQMRRNRRK